MTKILVLNGPNLNMLGKREPDVYGTANLHYLEQFLTDKFPSYEIEIRQTNSEAELIVWLHQAFQDKQNIVLNPAAFTHYSYALHDAVGMLTSAGIKVIEVHITNPHSREEFRQHSTISAVASGVIAGFGFDSYRLAIASFEE